MTREVRLARSGKEAEEDQQVPLRRTWLICSHGAERVGRSHQRHLIYEELDPLEPAAG